MEIEEEQEEKVKRQREKYTYKRAWKRSRKSKEGPQKHSKTLLSLKITSHKHNQHIAHTMSTKLEQKSEKSKEKDDGESRDGDGDSHFKSTVLEA